VKSFRNRPVIAVTMCVAGVLAIWMTLSAALVYKMASDAKERLPHRTYAFQPVSIGLVLDVSGSMNSNGRIGTLKIAITHLLKKLEAADPSNDYVRSGLVTYSSSIRERVGMNWGVSHTLKAVPDFSGGGGTKSTSAFELVGNWLYGHTELSQRRERELTVHRFIVFTTDGTNNYSWDDTATMALCHHTKQQGVKVYAVAYEAPTRGQTLLRYCASDQSYYFNANNSEEFLVAFEEIGKNIETVLRGIVGI